MAEIEIPPGYGIRRVPPAETAARLGLAALLDRVLIFEPPRTRGPFRAFRYVISADVADGIGQDRSSVDVVRLPTVEEPAEQVAHFLSDCRTPTQLASVIAVLGHLYRDDDGYEACAAIELNNHGLATQEVLQLHLGYPHFYRWEIIDAAEAGKRFTPRIGWSTTVRTRPIILSHFHAAVTTIDPVSGLPDLRINSPHTLDELADFQTDGALWEASAARGAHDDCILSLSIGYYVCWKLAGGELEPLAERRRRLGAMKARAAETATAPRSWRNSAFTEDEMRAGDLCEDYDTDAPAIL